MPVLGPSVPYVRFEGSDRDRLVEETRSFLDLEREDLRGLEAMGQVVRSYSPQKLGFFSSARS